MRGEYDVIVVGAGPGGSIAAQTAAGECDVLLIKKAGDRGAGALCRRYCRGGDFKIYST